MWWFNYNRMESYSMAYFRCNAEWKHILHEFIWMYDGIRCLSYPRQTPSDAPPVLEWVSPSQISTRSRKPRLLALRETRRTFCPLPFRLRHWCTVVPAVLWNVVPGVGNIHWCFPVPTTCAWIGGYSVHSLQIVVGRHFHLKLHIRWRLVAPVQKRHPPKTHITVKLTGCGPRAMDTPVITPVT